MNGSDLFQNYYSCWWEEKVGSRGGKFGTFEAPKLRMIYFQKHLYKLPALKPRRTACAWRCFSNALNPECRLMFILTSLWEVAAVALLRARTDLVVQAVRATQWNSSRKLS